VGVLGEEIIWRGYLLPRMEQTHGRAAWLINGLLWNGLCHLYTLYNLCTDLPFMLLIPFLAQRTQSTWTAVILHLGLQWLAFASLRAAFVACRLPLLSCFFLSVSFVFFLLVINAPIGLCNELTLASLAFIFFAHNTQRA
jgi:membrane protease YdiL (CAAX protease family)